MSGLLVATCFTSLLAHQNFGLLVAICFTSLLGHQNFELLSSVTLLQKFIKFFYEALIQWFTILNL
jgi:hypothetical protein